MPASVHVDADRKEVPLQTQGRTLRPAHGRRPSNDPRPSDFALEIGRVACARVQGRRPSPAGIANSTHAERRGHAASFTSALTTYTKSLQPQTNLRWVQSGTNSSLRRFPDGPGKYREDGRTRGVRSEIHTLPCTSPAVHASEFPTRRISETGTENTETAASIPTPISIGTRVRSSTATDGCVSLICAATTACRSTVPHGPSTTSTTRNHSGFTKRTRVLSHTQITRQELDLFGEMAKAVGIEPAPKRRMYPRTKKSMK